MLEQKKRKVLMVSVGGLDHGGVQAVLMSTVRALSDKFQFDVIVFSDKEKYYDKEFLSMGGHIFRVPRYEGMNKSFHQLDVLFFSAFSYRKITRIIMDNGPYQAIHCHNDYDSSVFLQIGKKMGIPVRIVHSHVVSSLGKGHYPRKIFNWLNRRGFKNASLRIGCSQEACESLFRNMSYKVVNNPYDERRFNRRQYQNLKNSNLIITQVGSYSDNKNQLFSIEVMDRIKKTHPKCIIRFVGFELEKGYFEKIDNRVKELSLRNNVEYYPHDANIPELLSSSSYFIFPSKMEGFGIVLIEAQAMGLKCFVSDSVSRLTNCGGCEYLPLGQGKEEIWARAICSSFELDNGNHKDYDCSMFSTARYSEIINKFYQGD